MTIKEIKDLNGGTLEGLDADFIEMLKDTPSNFAKDLIESLKQ